MITDLDYAVLDFIQEVLKSPTMDAIMKFITTLGNDGIIWVVICALLLISPKTRYIGFIGLVSLLFSLILNEYIVKNIIARDRPFVGLDNIELIIDEPHSYSFPSGHTASSFAAAFVFGKYFKKPYAIITYIFAGLMAFSRMYLYVHFTTDIFAGILMGLLCSVLAILLFNGYKRHQERKLMGNTSS